MHDEFCPETGHFKIDPTRVYLIISGDLGYRAVREEFSEAKDCLESICGGIPISKERVVIVPGNHDVNWMLSQDERKRRFDHFPRFVFDFYGAEMCKKKFPCICFPPRGR